MTSPVGCRRSNDVKIASGMSDLNQHLCGLLAEVCGTAPSSLGPESAPGVTPGWDSVTNLSFIAAVEDEFGITISTKEALGLKNLADMASLVCQNLERALRAFERDGAVVVSPPIDDLIQRVTVQFLREPSGELWELVAPLVDVAAGPLQSRLAHGGGLDHVCYELEADDGTLEETLAAEVARGARVVCEPVMAAAFTRRIAFVFRRSQRLVELVEPRRPGQLF